MKKRKTRRKNAPLTVRPSWAHPEAATMDVLTATLDSGGVLVLRNMDNCSVRIEPTARNGAPSREWRVSTHVIHGEGDTDQCVRRLTDEELRTAFAAEQGPPMILISGKFIRQGRWLNIPQRGTGREKDPNLSIFVTTKIQKAVQALLAH